MDLPSGFDPATGTFRGLSAPRIQSNYNTASSYASGFSFSGSSSYGRTNLWDRFNNAIASIGNWVDDIIEPVSGWISLIAMIIGGIGLLIWVFSDFNLLYIILRIVGACIIGYIMMICLGIGLYCISFLLKAIRFVFWNGRSLLATLAVAACIFCYHAYGSSNVAYDSVETEVVAPATQTYRCTAWELNIRSKPNKTSRVLGKIKKGDTVEVYETVDGFAKIRYNGQDGYASMKYLTIIQ